MTGAMDGEARSSVVVLGCVHAVGGAVEERPISVPCAGSVGLEALLLPFARGAAGALLVSCEPDECRHRRCGDERPCDASGAGVVSAVREALTSLGISPRRAVHRAVARDADVDELIGAVRRDVLALGDWTRGEAPALDEAPAELLLADRAARLFVAIQGLAGPPTGAQPRPTEEGEVLWTGCTGLRARAWGDADAPPRAAETLWLESGRAASSIIRGRCCGWPLAASSGEGATPVMEANAALIAATGARKVVTSCAHCAVTMRRGWKAAGGSPGVEIVELARWAAEALEPVRVEGTLAFVDAPTDLQADRRAKPELALFSGAGLSHLPWPAGASQANVSGAARRRALADLLEGARRRDARAVIVPSRHHAAAWRAMSSGGAWQTDRTVPILDVAEALVSFSQESIHGAR